MTHEEIQVATDNFTKSVGLRAGKSKRYTRFLQPGMWDLTGKLVLRTRKYGRHMASAAYTDRQAIAALVGEAEICEY
jgi:hypothetical protein